MDSPSFRALGACGSGFVSYVMILLAKVPLQNLPKSFSIVGLALCFLYISGTYVIKKTSRTDDQSSDEKTRLQLAKIAESIDIYRVQNKTYPATMDDLLNQPSGAENWRGPYILENKTEDLWGSKILLKFEGKNYSSSAL